MSIEKYIVYRDKFEPADPGNSLDFPCCACVHREKTDREQPCVTCDHNACAKQDEEQ
jgi:hypothetical protein